MSGQDPLGVHIGAREIYDQVVGLRDDVRPLVDSVDEIKKDIDDHEDRLRTVERWRYGVPGALLISAAGAVTAFLKSTGKV